MLMLNCYAYYGDGCGIMECKMDFFSVFKMIMVITVMVMVIMVMVAINCVVSRIVSYSLAAHSVKASVGCNFDSRYGFDCE